MAVGCAGSSKGKGILGSPPGFSWQEQVIVSPMADLGHSNSLSRGMLAETNRGSFRMACPMFNGDNFRG